MPPRQARPLPSLFLMTDERMGGALWLALERLPRGAGVVFRHYGLDVRARRDLFEKVRRITRRRGLLLLLAGSPREAAAWRADGAHGRSGRRSPARLCLRTAPVHDRRALLAARHCDLFFVSPVFATRTHPGAPALGRVRTGLLIGAERSRAIALGGMTAGRARSLRSLGIRHWAAIDGLAFQEASEAA